MSSFRRNISRAHSARRSRALGAGLALALASGAALAGGAHRFVFTAFSDTAGGADVVAGRYQAALQELKSDPIAMDFDPSTIDTNLCVAYSMTLQQQKARAACDAAVRDARDQRAIQWTQVPESGNDHLAVAYANRAVMYWLFQDEAAAREDLGKAQRLSPRADFVAQNLAALKMHAEMARAKMHRVVAQAGTPGAEDLIR